MNSENEPCGITAKKYLLQVRRKEAIITGLRSDRENLLQMLHTLGGGMEGERVQKSRSNDKFGSIFSKIDEKERLIDKKLKELIDFKVNVAEQISTLQDHRYIEILHKRYIQFLSFEQIAVDMGYSYRYVTKMHGYALLEFERSVLKKGA